MTRTVVVGPSCSGKSTYAWGERAEPDLVVDFDRIAEALGNTEPWDATGTIGEAAFRARLSAVNSALELDGNSWIIHGEPSAAQIDEYVEAGCVFVVLDPGLETCLERAAVDERPEGTEERIRDWYNNPPSFPETAEVTVVTEGDLVDDWASECEGVNVSARNRRKPREWFRVEAKADEPTTAAVYIYDEIGESWWGGVSPKALVDEINKLDVETLTVHINSPGGAAWDGITIMNALRAHKARVDVVVDGLAASAASIVAMAGDTVTMNRGSQMMIHDASGGAWGPASIMEETAGILNKLSDSYADIYAARTGHDRKFWREAMKAETWYTAEEAVEAGLANQWDDPYPESIEDLKDDAAFRVNAFDLSRFKYKGRAFAPRPILAAALVAEQAPVSTEPGRTDKEEEVTMGDTFMAGVRERLGITDAEATEEAVLTALEDALTKPAEKNEIPDGAVVVDATAYEQLQADAAAGRQAMDQIDAARRDQIIADAMSSGRITAASKDQWRAQLDADEKGIHALLAGMPANTVPVAEVGHSDKTLDADEALYAKYMGESEEN